MGVSAQNRELLLCWWVDHGPFIAIFGFSMPPSTKKRSQI